MIVNEKVAFIQHYLAGEYTALDSHVLELQNPATGETIALCDMADKALADKAVQSAKSAAQSWQQLTPIKRARYLNCCLQSIELSKENLAQHIVLNHGKTLADALGEVQRATEVIEFAVAAPHLLKGQYSPHISSGHSCYNCLEPTGVSLIISPYNFPVMVPMWFIPLALIAGNTVVLKASEQTAYATSYLIELLNESGLPPGVVNFVNADAKVANYLVNHPDINTVSFVGSTAVAKSVYQQATQQGKRVQALGGAKNHAIILPDADLDDAVSGLISAAYGSAGQRCMAISVAVAVGDVKEPLEQKLTQAIQQIQVGDGLAPDTQMGPLISKHQLEKVTAYIQAGIAERATLLVDGRSFSNNPGYYLGPTLFTNIAEKMTVYQEEIFGPVLVIISVETLSEAIALVNRHRYANGAVLFTRSGHAAATFEQTVKVGMVGVNVPLPVPLSYYSFGGVRDSFLGDLPVHGQAGLQFFTQQKTVTKRWPEPISAEESAPNFTMPVHS